MRLMLNVSTVALCGALAGITALAPSVSSRAASAIVVTPVVAALSSNSDVLVRRSGGIEAHFSAANSTHDGRLTKAQAEQSDWTRVAKHFDEIDTDHKGWISVDQIHAFNKSHRKHRKDAAAA